MSDNADSGAAGYVDQLLYESGLDDDGALRPALLELRALAAQPPQPSAAVAALLVPAAQREDTPVMPAHRTTAGARAVTDEGAVTDELAARRRAKRRIALTTLSVAVSLAAGGAVAAASDQGIRDSIGQLNHAVTSFVSTIGGGPANQPVTTPVPVPQRPGGSPSAPAPGTPSAPAPGAAAPSSGAPGTQNNPEPGASRAVPHPKLPAPENIMPDVPATLPGDIKSSIPSVPAEPPVPLPSHVP